MLRQRRVLELLQRHGMTHAAEALPGLAEALQELGPASWALTSLRGYAGGRRRGEAATAAPPAPAAGKSTARRRADDDDNDGDDTVLTLPSDLSLIARLNPELHEAMLAHEKQQSGPTARDELLGVLEGALPESNKRGVRMNKTSLGRLPVDRLRQLAARLNLDGRGRKEEVVARLLQAVAEEEHWEAGPPPDSFRPGVVSRQQVAAAQRRQELAHEDPGTQGVSEGELRASLASMVQAGGDRAPFHQVFQPQEVANLLLEARGDDVCIIDVRHRCPFTDYMVLATARSQRLVHMLAAAVLHELKGRCREVAPGVAPGVEGLQEEAEWLVVDAGSVVVHVFLEGYRKEYDLEELWGDKDGSNLTWLEPKQTVHTLHTISV